LASEYDQVESLLIILKVTIIYISEVLFMILFFLGFCQHQREDFSCKN
jgi:hypothetical protein